MKKCAYLSIQSLDKKEPKGIYGECMGHASMFGVIHGKIHSARSRPAPLFQRPRMRFVAPTLHTKESTHTPFEALPTPLLLSRRVGRELEVLELRHLDLATTPCCSEFIFLFVSYTSHRLKTSPKTSRFDCKHREFSRHTGT